MIAAVQTAQRTAPDWSREMPTGRWAAGPRLLACIRLYQSLDNRRGLRSLLRRRWCVLEHRFWSVIGAADIPLNCRIGGGLLLPHVNGIVIHPEARIGPNCLIFQQVTIGAGGSIPGLPCLGSHVYVGAGAKILGGVCVGDYARIGANAVVLSDVPAGATAVGVPARIVESS